MAAAAGLRLLLQQVRATVMLLRANAKASRSARLCFDSARRARKRKDAPASGTAPRTRARARPHTLAQASNSSGGWSCDDLSGVPLDSVCHFMADTCEEGEAQEDSSSIAVVPLSSCQHSASVGRGTLHANRSSWRPPSRPRAHASCLRRVPHPVEHHLLLPRRSGGLMGHRALRGAPERSARSIQGQADAEVDGPGRQRTSGISEQWGRQLQLGAAT